MEKLINDGLSQKKIRLSIKNPNFKGRLEKRPRTRYVEAVVSTTPMFVYIYENGQEIILNFLRNDLENLFIDENLQFINSTGFKVTRKAEFSFPKNLIDLAKTIDFRLALADQFILENYNDPNLKILWENEDNRILR